MERLGFLVLAGRRSVPAVAAVMILAALALPAKAGGASVVINEFMSSNGQTLADEDGDFEDWIELTNIGGESQALEGWGLSDDMENPFRWVFPDVTLGPGEHLLVWASGKDRTDPASELHTNFSIASAGEELLLTTPEGAEVDFVDPVEVPRDVSYGRMPEGGDEWLFFPEPTPGDSNTTEGFDEVLPPPVFSVASGFHEEEFSLSIKHDRPDVRIIYTLDGSIPDPDAIGGVEYPYKHRYAQFPGQPLGEIETGSYQSRAYEQPIIISDRSSEAGSITWRSSSYLPPDSYTPTGTTFKGVVVRARAVHEDALPSPVRTHTYFVTPEGEARFELPVISLTTQEDHLFDYYDGNHVPGVDYDNWRRLNPNATPVGSSPANYRRRGHDAEFPISMELFEPGEGLVFSQELGYRIHGGFTRYLPQKSFRLYARSSYDDMDTMTHPFFPGLERRGTGGPLDEFRRLLLRNSGNDAERSRIRDMVIQAIAEPLDLDRQAGRPAVLFLNGEFWGLINMRERLDEHYISSHYGIEPDDIVIMEMQRTVKQGTAADRAKWDALRQYIEENNLAEEEHLAHVEARVDIENFLRYYVLQIYAKNTDWPGGNLEYWRERVPLGKLHAPPGRDGRWRWFVFDLDHAFGPMIGYDYTHNTLAFATAEDGPSWPNPPWSTKIFRNLLENPSVRDRFINLMADHMNTTFHPERVNEVVDHYSDLISPHLAEHVERWRNTRDTSPAFMKEFGERRPGHVRQHVIDQFGLDGTIPVTLDVSDVSGGSVRINSITIDETTPGPVGSSAPYPWTGTYFGGVPLDLEAVPRPGYVFAGWEGVEEQQRTFFVTPGGELTVQALFEEAALIHYWNFNRTAELLEPSHTVGGGTIRIEPGSDTEIEYDEGHGFDAGNARLGDTAGHHLRLNNPLGAQLNLEIPTTGYGPPIVRYETRRSGQGAGVQVVEYTTDGESHTEFKTYGVHDNDPELRVLDFADVEGSADNPDFALRITFEEGYGGEEGNNRFDNITVEAAPLDGTASPPLPTNPPGIIRAIEAASTSINLDSIFSNPGGGELDFEAEVLSPAPAEVTVAGSILELEPSRRGKTRVAVTASDGVHEPAAVLLHVLVYPRPHALGQGAFRFDEWSALEPEGSYPEHMLFLQTDLTDPGPGAPLDYPYFLDPEHYHPDDEDTIGFPYNNTRRTRLTGLGEDGIAFINTGRDRDLGGALLALDTRGVNEANVSFLAGTVLENSRIYGLRLQYRIGTEGEFSDVKVDGSPVEYIRDEDGHTQFFEEIPLPGELFEQEYVQLLWRYYHVGVTDGPRAKLRLDDIAVEPAGQTTWFLY